MSEMTEILEANAAFARENARLRDTLKQIDGFCKRRSFGSWRHDIAGMVWIAFNSEDSK